MDLHIESSPEGVGLGSGQLSRDADGSYEGGVADFEVDEIIDDLSDNAFSIPPWPEGSSFDEPKELAQGILGYVGSVRFATAGRNDTTYAMTERSSLPSSPMAVSSP